MEEPHFAVRDRVSNLLTGITLNLRLRNGGIVHERLFAGANLIGEKDHMESARNFSFLQNRSFSMGLLSPKRIITDSLIRHRLFHSCCSSYRGLFRRASHCYVRSAVLHLSSHGMKRQRCSSSSQSWERYRLRCMRGGFFVYSTATKSSFHRVKLTHGIVNMRWRACHFSNRGCA